MGLKQRASPVNTVLRLVVGHGRKQEVTRELFHTFRHELSPRPPYSFTSWSDHRWFKMTPPTMGRCHRGLF